MNKIIYSLVITVLLSACGTTKKATTNKVPVPAGFSFEKVEYSNNSLLKSTNMPVSGSKFTVKKSDTPEAYSIYKFAEAQIMVISPLSKGFVGTLDEQIDKIYNKPYFAPSRTSAIKLTDKHTVDTLKMTIANNKVIRFDISKEPIQGYSSLSFGYIVQHGEKAMMFWIKDLYITPEVNINEYKKSLDTAFKYMIETVEFKE